MISSAYFTAFRSPWRINLEPNPLFRTAWPVKSMNCHYHFQKQFGDQQSFGHLNVMCVIALWLFIRAGLRSHLWRGCNGIGARSLVSPQSGTIFRGIMFYYVLATLIRYRRRRVGLRIWLWWTDRFHINHPGTQFFCNNFNTSLLSKESPYLKHCYI